MIKDKQIWIKARSLFFVAVLMVIVYLTYNTYGNLDFALSLRGKKVIGFVLVAITSSVATISFQTLTNNKLLSPGILGLDNLYVLIQTSLFFFIGGVKMLSQESIYLFLGTILIMTILSTLIIVMFVRKEKNDLYEVLMIGIVSGTFFSSISTFLQVIMNPNEYDMLQGKLFASFNNVNTNHMIAAIIIILVACIYFLSISSQLDVLTLGRDAAVNLGINVHRIQILSLVFISMLTATSTALVGPTVFIGFITSTISYIFFGSFNHRNLFICSSLLGVILLVGGQFLVEQVFGFSTTISVIIQFLGGVIFIGKILRERNV